MELDTNSVLLIIFFVMLFSILSGIHIAFAFGMSALVGNVLIFGGMDGEWAIGLRIALRGLGSVAYEYLRNEVFAAIPLFLLLGDFVSRSGSAADLFNLINRGLRMIPGRLAVATVGGNTVFSAVTGVSIAAAAAFSRIAYPQMRRHGYDRSFSVGVVAGSACLGMILPPSVLLIVWGITIEHSISQLFMAGVIPGLIIALFFGAYIIGAVLLKPTLAPKHHEESDSRPMTMTWAEIASAFGIAMIILVVLGGIWGGVLTPTEAAGVGAAAAMILGVMKGMRPRDLGGAVLSSCRASAPIMILLLTAAMYSKFMEVAGMSSLIRDVFAAYDLGEVAIIIVIVLIWLLLGMILDSISIILITLPIFAPLVADFMDPNAFAIFGILAVEAGLLTPPFGLLVFTVKSTVEDRAVKLAEIFRGSVPYWIIMLIVMIMIWFWPALATWLPQQMAG